VRVRIERTFLTTASGTRVIEADPEISVVESSSPTLAIIEFVTREGARLLGSIAVDGNRATATAWKNRMFVIHAEGDSQGNV
jgi:hypothetical protein